MQLGQGNSCGTVETTIPSAQIVIAANNIQSREIPGPLSVIETRRGCCETNKLISITRRREYLQYPEPLEMVPVGKEACFAGRESRAWCKHLCGGKSPVGTVFHDQGALVPNRAFTKRKHE